MENEKCVKDRKVILSTLWVFYVLNILYADILNLIGETTVEDAELIALLISPGMLLGAAIFLEIAMIMIVLSRLLKHGINRWFNMVIATLHTLGVLASIFVGDPTIFYIFFVMVEVATLLFIIWCAWSWKAQSEKS
ncbi:DUF6326 family protein [Microbulbifer sp. TYP-18]|uniref:DUF6326 family protein n=1 Tax=Microbulbifer sp. TYP-18 TaxID=3230024 RepID=UPI0034C663DA